MYSILQLKSNVSNSIVVELSSYMWDWSCTDILVQHREVWLIRPQLQKAMYWQECLERVMLQPFAFLISKLILFCEVIGTFENSQVVEKDTSSRNKEPIRSEETSRDFETPKCKADTNTTTSLCSKHRTLFLKISHTHLWSINICWQNIWMRNDTRYQN